MPRRIRIDGAVLRAVGASVMLLSVPSGVPAIVGLHIAADLEADVGAWDVVEALAVERADFDILDGLRFHWQIGCLGAAYCGQRRRGAEKHSLRYCHVSPPEGVTEGRDGPLAFLLLLLAIPKSVVRAPH